MSHEKFQDCIDACVACAVECSHCATECLKEEDVKMMARCIQLDMECAAVCYASAQLMSLGSNIAKELCRICAGICRECGEECSKHQDEHCQECARLCRECAEECSRMAA